MLVYIPVVDLVPLLGPLGILPELCTQIKVWAALLSSRRVYEVMLNCDPDAPYKIHLLPWGRITNQAAFKRDGRVWVNCKTIMRFANTDDMFWRLCGLDTKWGFKCRSCAEDDWILDMIQYRQEGIVASDDCPGERLLLTCGLVAGCYDEH